jgi:hypothetical protein
MYLLRISLEKEPIVARPAAPLLPLTARCIMTDGDPTALTRPTCGLGLVQGLSLSKSFNGLLVACVDTALYNGANFAGYLWLKNIYAARSGGASMGPIVALLAGMVSGSFASSVAMPLNVITTKRQASAGSDKPLSARGAAASIIRDDGLPGLWRGYAAAVYKNIDPAITFFVFDWLSAARLATGAAPSAFATFILGLVSKVVAIILSYPLVLAQARIHAMDKSGAAKKDKDGTDAADSGVYSSVSDVLMRVVASEGLLGLYSGMWATVAGESLKNALKFMLKDQFATAAFAIAHSVL